MIYDHSTKQQRELNASLRACMRIVKLGAGLYQLQDSTGRVMLSPTSKGNITQWLSELPNRQLRNGCVLRQG